LRGESLADLGIVGHLRERPPVGAAATASTGAAVVGRRVRVVEAVGAVAEAKHQRREATEQADGLELRADDRDLLVERVAGEATDRWLARRAIELEPRARSGAEDLERGDPRPQPRE